MASCQNLFDSSCVGAGVCAVSVSSCDVGRGWHPHFLSPSAFISSWAAEEMKALVSIFYWVKNLRTLQTSLHLPNPMLLVVTLKKEYDTVPTCGCKHPQISLVRALPLLSLQASCLHNIFKHLQLWQLGCILRCCTKLHVSTSGTLNVSLQEAAADILAHWAPGRLPLDPQREQQQ